MTALKANKGELYIGIAQTNLLIEYRILDMCTHLYCVAADAGFSTHKITITSCNLNY